MGFFSQLCRNRDERECLSNFGFNVTTMSENVVFDSNMMMNVTRTLNYLDVVPTPLRLSSLYYKIYVLALNSLFASLIPFASLIYMNFCTVIGKYHFEICYNCTMLQKLSKCKVKAWLLKFDHFTATQILRENQFWQIQMVEKCHFWQF